MLTYANRFAFGLRRVAAKRHPHRQSAWHKEAEREFGVRPFRPLTFLSRAIGEAQTNFFCHQHFVLLENLWHIM